MKYSRFNIFIKTKEGDDYYLFNTNSGSTFLVDMSIKQKIENGEMDFLSEEKKKEYKEAGIILENEIDENRIFSYLFNKQKYNNEVLNLTVLLTYDCNLRCVYCYEGAGEDNKGSLTDKSRDAIFEFIKQQMQQRKSSVLSMVLFGGEPLLNFDKNIAWLDRIKEYCDTNKKKFVTTLITNGILINEPIMEKLAEYNCQTIQITLDGIKEIHDTRRKYKDGRGSFREVINGIKMIYNNAKLNNPVIRINIDKTNINEVKSLLSYLSEEKLNGCYIDFGIVKGTTKACSSYTGNCFIEEELGEILDELWIELERKQFNFSIQPQKRYLFCGLYCDASFTISPYAEIYKCWDHVGMSEHVMGRISPEGDIVDIKYPFIDWMSHNPLEVEECRKCQYLPACGGGCGSVSYSQSGSYHAKGCYKTIGVIEKQVERLFLQKNKIM